MTTTRPLYPWQREAYAYARSVRHPAVWMEMRLGKTAVAIRETERRHTGARALVVAPNSALGGWEDELAAEGVTDVMRLRGPRIKRLAQLADSRGWVLTNTESWQVVPEIAGRARCDECSGRGWVSDEDERRKCVACLGRGSSRVRPAPFDAVILDESTFVKNPRARVTQFFLENFREVAKRWSLTGLPNPEGDLDLWCQLAWLDGHAFGHASYWSFRARCFDDLYSGWTAKPEAKRRIEMTISARAFILRQKDAGIDVQKVRERRKIDLPPKLAKAYEKAEREFVLEYPEIERQETMFAAVRWQWLRQMCGGFVDHELVWPGKRDALTGLLMTELRRSRVVVWFTYNQEVETVRRVMQTKRPARVITGEVPATERDEIVRGFRAGHFEVLLCQQAAMCKGVDLSVADAMIYYSCHASGEMRAQSDERLTKPGREGAVLIVDMIVPGTVDEDVADLVAEKSWRSGRTLARAIQLRIARRASGG